MSPLASHPLLPFVPLLPLASSMLLASLPLFSSAESWRGDGKGSDLRLRQFALSASLCTWLLIALLVPQLQTAAEGLAPLLGTGEEGAAYGDASLSSFGHPGSLSLATDGLSLLLLLLTGFISPIALLSSFGQTTHNARSNLSLLLLLEALLLLTFLSTDLLLFYVSFEAVLIPLFLIVGLHGSTERRIRAAFLLFLYTLLGSFGMLLSIASLVYALGTTDLSSLALVGPSLSPSSQRWIWLGIFLSIAVKSPLVPLHGWLFRAHAESSLAGSIFLAGVVLKLALYAYLRLLAPVLPHASEYFRPLLLTLALLSLVHGSLATVRQTDLKAFVAYSSVGHMAIVLLGLGAGTINGLCGANLLSLGHGFVSPALFVVTGGVLYERYGSRLVRYYRGLGSSMPSLKLWFFLASVASMATPGSINWLGEFFSIAGAFEAAPLAGALGALSVLLGAVYTIWLFNQVMGGSPSPSLALAGDLTAREWTTLLWLVSPAFLLGVFPHAIERLLLPTLVGLST